MRAELRDGFYAVRGLGHQKHVRLRSNDRGEPFAKDRMIFDTEDANLLLRSRQAGCPIQASERYTSQPNTKARKWARHAYSVRCFVNSIAIDGQLA
jgi:hypothetical protein